MKILIVLASLSFFAVSPSLACLQTYGSVPGSVFPRVEYSLNWAGVTDNGKDVCDTAWGAARLDHDGHFSVPCLAGYVYAFKTDASTAWYSNGVSSYSVAQSPQGVGGLNFEWHNTYFGC